MVLQNVLLVTRKRNLKMNRRQTIKNLFLSGLGLFGTKQALASNDNPFSDACEVISNELITNTNSWILYHSHIVLCIFNNSKLSMNKCSEIADSIMFGIFCAPRESHIKNKIEKTQKDFIPLNELNNEIDKEKSFSYIYRDLD